LHHFLSDLRKLVRAPAPRTETFVVDDRYDGRRWRSLFEPEIIPGMSPPVHSVASGLWRLTKKSGQRIR
jgi:hypothetical protein